MKNGVLSLNKLNFGFQIVEYADGAGEVFVLERGNCCSRHEHDNIEDAMKEYRDTLAAKERGELTML